MFHFNPSTFNISKKKKIYHHLDDEKCNMAKYNSCHIISSTLSECTQFHEFNSIDKCQKLSIKYAI